MDILQDERTVFYATFLLAIFLLSLKPTANHVSLLNTLIHETGHALTTLFFNGKVRKVELLSNAGGITTSQSQGVTSAVIILLSGYFFSSATGYFFFFLINIGQHKTILYLLSVLAVINIFVLVRNRYGRVWLLVFLMILSLVPIFNNAHFSLFLSLFMASVIFIKAFTSSFKPLVMSFDKAKKSGDAYLLQKRTGIPAFLWGFIFSSQALIFAIATIFNFFPHLQ